MELVVVPPSAVTRKVSVPAISDATPLWETEGERQAYLRGAQHGNTAAVRLLIGLCVPVKLVVNPNVPEGECQLHVHSMDAVRLEGTHWNLLKP